MVTFIFVSRDPLLFSRFCIKVSQVCSFSPNLKEKKNVKRTVNKNIKEKFPADQGFSCTSSEISVEVISPILFPRFTGHEAAYRESCNFT